jgi:hypothetical protein
MPSYFPGMVLEFNVYGKTPARVLNADFKLHPGVCLPRQQGTRRGWFEGSRWMSFCVPAVRGV